jgi:hypothetical protein
MNDANGPTPSKKRKLVEDVSEKKSFLKNRSSQHTEDLNLSEGISRGMKNVKIDNVGLGSRRVLEDKSQKTQT